MSLLSGIGAIAGGLGSLWSANSQADAADQAGLLAPWLKPYVKGQGDIPAHIAGNPLINTNWMDYIQQQGQGNWDAPWQPMTAESPWFNPDQTFTPQPADPNNPYGTLPPPPPPEAAPAPPQQAPVQQAQQPYWWNALEGGGMVEGPDTSQQEWYQAALNRANGGTGLLS